MSTIRSRRFSEHGHKRKADKNDRLVYLPSSACHRRGSPREAGRPLAPTRMGRRRRICRRRVRCCNQFHSPPHASPLLVRFVGARPPCSARPKSACSFPAGLDCDKNRAENLQRLVSLLGRRRIALRHRRSQSPSRNRRSGPHSTGRCDLSRRLRREGLNTLPQRGQGTKNIWLLSRGRYSRRNFKKRNLSKERGSAVQKPSKKPLCIGSGKLSTGSLPRFALAISVCACWPCWKIQV